MEAAEPNDRACRDQPMKFANICLIAAREIRDHLRDRRTLAMMILLPVGLYPILAISVYQLAQFLEEKPCRVLVVGADLWMEQSGVPKLLDEDHPQYFHPALFSDLRRQRLLEVISGAEVGIAGQGTPEILRREIEHLVASARVDVAVWFPPEFCRFVDEWARGEAFGFHRAGEGSGPQLFYSTASDRSQVAYGRLQAVLDRWRELWRRQALAARGVPQEVLDPFGVAAADVAVVRGRQGAALWARILPVLLIIWAATGAFYPAIDACAGEKERGTLETLLISPAKRVEIVLGKLCSVALFSALTSLTNVWSMMVSGWLFLQRLPQFGAPPLRLSLWLVAAVIPIAILFAAVSVALAARARSTREAQYYLMPVILITMPLVLLPTTPGVEMSLGMSLIPVTGLVLLLKELLAGQIADQWGYVVPVAGVTVGLCVLAVRTAIRQFESEKVLFREAEILSLRTIAWAVGKLRNQSLGPRHGVAVGLVILSLKLAWSVRIQTPTDFRGFVHQQILAQVVAFALPAVLGAILLSRWPAATLSLRFSSWKHLLTAIILAFLLQPSAVFLQQRLRYLFPPGHATQEFLHHLDTLVMEGSLPLALLAFALIPAVCEELAFRGMVLGSFVARERYLLGVVTSALIFAAAHVFAVQQIMALALGLVLGAMVVSTGSLWPAMVFHAVYNGGMLWASRIGAASPAHLVLRPALERFDLAEDPRATATILALLAMAVVFVWGLGFGWQLNQQRARPVNREQGVPH